MHLKNVTLCRSFWKKATGLMFKRKSTDFIYVFEFSRLTWDIITMHWVFFPIDVLFLDDKQKIIEIKLNLKPFRNYAPKQKFLTFIEVPKGFVKKNNLRLGMKLTW